MVLDLARDVPGRPLDALVHREAHGDRGLPQARMLLPCSHARMAARNLLPICSKIAGEVIGLPRWSCRK
jgi:hypothetical protein